MNVLSLLRSQNRCLQRLLEASENALEALERGEFDALDSLQLARDSALRALDLFDRKISEAVTLLPPEARTAELREQVRASLAAKQNTVHEILSLDDRILARIEEEKKRVLGDLGASRKASATLNKFRSNWISEAGEELDATL